MAKTGMMLNSFVGPHLDWPDQAVQSQVMCINARQSLCVFTVCVLPVYVFCTFPFRDILLVAKTQRDNIHRLKIFVQIVPYV